MIYRCVGISNTPALTGCRKQSASESVSYLYARGKRRVSTCRRGLRFLGVVLLCSGIMTTNLLNQLLIVIVV